MACFVEFTLRLSGTKSSFRKSDIVAFFEDNEKDETYTVLNVRHFERKDTGEFYTVHVKETYEKVKKIMNPEIEKTPNKATIIKREK